MPISRDPSLKGYYEYTIEYAVIPKHTKPSTALMQLTIGDFNWVDIPSYQRGISWDLPEVEDFLDSNSVILGNIILGRFTATGQIAARLPHQQTYVVLVDGLQRFAVGTMLLNALYEKVLSPQPSRPNDADGFALLKARVQPFAAVFQHNDIELRHHPRRAIADQYSLLADKINRYIEIRLDLGDGQNLAKQITRTFLAKQIAIDIYSNFVSHVELMYTFLGLNTVRVDLGPVDLLRSYLVEKATSSDWQSSHIEDMENEFTSIFTKDEKPNSELLPFVAVILNAIRSPNLPERVFPSWSGQLIRNEVLNFLEFVRKFQDCDGQNPYFDEIRAYGAIPYATILLYYYCQYIHEGKPEPSFLSGGSGEDTDLHQFLVANARVYLDGRIGRTRTYAEDVLAGSVNSLSIVASQMSQQFLKKRLDEQVDPAWLRTVLNRVDKKKSRLIFNAMLLPEKTHGWGTQQFSILDFGQKSIQYNIDHLIPESMGAPNQAGYSEINSLRNFAPLRSNQNRIAKATSCSTKLGQNGIYDSDLQNYPNYHPFVTWLVNEHAPILGAHLDSQARLEPNATPAIGDQRIDFITNHLLSRI